MELIAMGIFGYITFLGIIVLIARAKSKSDNNPYNINY